MSIYLSNYIHVHAAYNQNICHLYYSFSLFYPCRSELLIKHPKHDFDLH
ncbi:hypothetical protein FHR92_003577 [Fontibacillus solani]|uniref:Uncharacterized protein n=1 Tax=Fontibacillus solani TaxID=1572857 RepID=A0A7W3XSZ9_9BACL|nr:hypothetical protein [Fontibacillus solani]